MKMGNPNYVKLFWLVSRAKILMRDGKTAIKQNSESIAGCDQRGAIAVRGVTGLPDAEKENFHRSCSLIPLFTICCSLGKIPYRTTLMPEV